MKHLLTLTLILLTMWPAVGAATVIAPPVPSDRGSDGDFQRSKGDGLNAQKHMARRRWKKMLRHSEAAWQTYKSPTYALLQGIALTKLKRNSEAFQWFLVAKAMKPSSAIMLEADRQLAELSRTLKVGVWEFKAPKEATVTIDGVQVAATVVGLSYGKHKVVIAKAGFETRETTVELNGPKAPGTIFSLKKVEVKVKPAIVDKVPTPSGQAEPESASIALPLGLIIGGVVLVGAGVGLHFWGDGSHDEADGLNGRWEGTYEASEAQFSSLRSDGETRVAAGAALYAIGGGLVIAGALLWALQEPSSESSADVVLLPSVRPHGLSATLSGRF